MDSTNVNTCPNRSKPGSSNACLKEELCCVNLSSIDFEEYPNDSSQVQNERNFSDIKIGHLHNDDPTEFALGEANDTDKIRINKTVKLDISACSIPVIKLEPANRTDDDFDENLTEFMHTNSNEKIVYSVHKNNEEILLNARKKHDDRYADNARRHRGIEQFDVNKNVKKPDDIVHVKIDSELSSHYDTPYRNEEKIENYDLEGEHPTNIVCCPDILGEIVQSHTKKSRKKIKHTDNSRKPGKIEPIDANERRRVMFIDVNSEVCQPDASYRCEETSNRCGMSFPATSPECRTDPVEEFILPDILPVKLQSRLDEGILAPSGTRGVEFSPKNIKKEFPISTHFKKDGTPTDFRPKMKKYIMEDFNMITGQNKSNEFTIKCSECNITFKKRFHLKEHNKLNHSKRTFTFACSWEGCNFTCFLEKGLKTHMISHTGEKPYICSLCDVGFTTRGKLNKHILTHSDTKPFTCHECNYTCSSKGDLKRHGVIHTGAKKFACTICDYAGYRKDNLKAHMLTHSGEKPFPCTICSVKCSRNGDLIRHMLTHTGEKPFGCSQCNYKCLKKSDLSRHALTHTGERRYPCTLCTHVSATKSNLKLHTAVHKS